MIVGQRNEIVAIGGGAFNFRKHFDISVPGNKSNGVLGGSLEARAKVAWFTQATPPTDCYPPPFGTCTPPGACGYGGATIGFDTFSTFVEVPSVTCSSSSSFGPYSFLVVRCMHPFSHSCEKYGYQANIQVSSEEIKAALGCPLPKKYSCPRDSGCKECVGTSPGGGVGAGGGGPGVGPADGGPHADLWYAAGGAGGAGLPGSTAWNSTLGRYWSHDYAMKIVMDPNNNHVWLITPYATFREFSSRNGTTNRYDAVSPSDEKRGLYYIPGTSGWELRELDGGVHVFDSSGKWTSSRDRHASVQKIGTYNGSGQLTTVTKPDGRSEVFTYLPSGKLETITEVGVAGGASRTWTYGWNGDDLSTILRPDGSYWEFQYSANPALPGYMTRMDLVTSTGIRRVTGAWEYDGVGNVVKSWRGDVAFNGPNAIDRLTYAWTNPALPTQLVVTDSLTPATASTYVIERDSNSTKPRVKSISGDCPVCGAGPNSSYEYADAANPLLPTRITDGSGKKTDFVYNSNGLLTTKTEAATDVLARTTLWTYGNSTYPGLVTQIDRPSTAGGAFVRRTEYLLNGNGDAATIRETGREGGSPYTYDTVFTFNAAGMVEMVDPPTPGTSDIVTYQYDAARGNLILTKRIDPTVSGTVLETTFGYDSFNRKTSEIDVNGVETVTAYDVLNRVDLVTKKGASVADDIVTDYTYNGFGDLDLVTRPLGNLVDYIFSDSNGDLAKGRLTAIEKKANAATPGERLSYGYDDLGRKVHEEMQSWNGSSWVGDSWKDYEYYGRCQLKKVLDAAGNAQETHYDCSGNVDKAWDAAHPSSSQTATPSTTYTYDALNRVRTVSQPWTGAGLGNAITTYGYDVQDHLTSVVDAVGGTTAYVYSDRDLMTQQTSEVSGTTNYTYSSRGSLATETDARGVTVSRNYDALNRPATVGALPAIDYPSANLDVNYIWGTNAGAFEKGRLKTISTSATSVTYGYDRFGRMTQDGALAVAFDKNDNATQITYPGGVIAGYTFDFADRQATLSVTKGGYPPEVVAANATYRPFGPLKSFDFGGGPTVTRSTDSRYFVDRISTSNGAFDWDYTVDAVGNPTGIDDVTTVNQDRSFGYQDYSYFLTTGNGPWGTKSWTYDKIGNRRTEVRGATTDTYTYVQAGGHDTSKLAQIAIGGGGGTKTYSYNASGDGTGAVLSATTTTYVVDDAHRMSDWTQTGATTMSATYDGRGLLSSTLFPPSKFRKESRFTFSTSGLLMNRSTIQLPGPLEVEDYWYFSFAGMPVALWRTNAAFHDFPIEKFVDDHLGTPVARVDTPTSNAGFDPFGVDYASNLNNLGTDHIFPGQTVDIFQQPNASLYYNVYRWYEPSTGRYTSGDRFISVNSQEPNLFAYAKSDPTRLIDPWGLFAFDDRSCCAPGSPNIRLAVEQGCALSRRPKCRQLLSLHAETPRGTPTGTRENFLGCYSRNCDPFSTRTTVRCQDAKQGNTCGATSLSGDVIEVHHNTSSMAGCVREDPAGPAHDANSVFHEIGHLCGIGQENTEPQWFRDVKKACQLQP